MSHPQTGKVQHRRQAERRSVIKIQASKAGDILQRAPSIASRSMDHSPYIPVVSVGLPSLKNLHNRQRSATDAHLVLHILI